MKNFFLSFVIIFVLIINIKAQNINVNGHVSYKNKTVKITTNDPIVNVLLEEDVHTVGEVSITADRKSLLVKKCGSNCL